MSFCVYKHTSPSGKIYIGISGIDPVKRWNCGCGYRSNFHFDNAIRKYGWRNFSHEILFDDLTKDEAEEMEIKLIQEYKSYMKRFGYNQDMGGNSIGKASDETRRKQSEKKKLLTGEKNPFYGKKHSDETKQLIMQTKSSLLEHNGELKPMSVWASELGISFQGLWRRIHVSKWSVEKALTEPHSKRYITYKGKSKRLCEWAKELGIGYDVLETRINQRKWSIERAFTTPPRVLNSPTSADKF